MVAELISIFSDIASAIRNRNGSATTYLPSEMGDAIRAIESKADAEYQTKTVTPSTQSQTVEPDTGYDGLSSVSVGAIPSQYIVPSGSQTITENGTVDVTSLAEVVVNVPTGGSSIQSGTFTPTSNSKTFSVTVDANTTNFVFYATDFDNGTAGAGWHTVGGVWFNSYGRTFIRYNEANQSVNTGSATLDGTTLTYTANYNLRTEKTYKWYAW